MKNAASHTLLLIGLLLLLGAAPANRQMILIRGSDATARTEADTTLGQYYTISYQLPAGLTSQSLDMAILEMYIDIGAKPRDSYLNEAPVVEVYALTQAYSGNVDLERMDVGTHADRPVARGNRRRVLIDITDIVHAHLDGSIANRGLILGSLTGEREGDMQIRTDVLGVDVAGRIRVYMKPPSR